MYDILYVIFKNIAVFPDGVGVQRHFVRGKHGRDKVGDFSNVISLNSITLLNAPTLSRPHDGE